MVWCTACGIDTPADCDGTCVCCVLCGRVHYEKELDFFNICPRPWKKGDKKTHRVEEHIPIGGGSFTGKPELYYTKRRPRRALRAKNAGPAQTAAGTARIMLTQKRSSSKIKYDDDDQSPDVKRNCIASHCERFITRKQLNEEETKAGTESDSDDQRQDDEDVDQTIAQEAYTKKCSFGKGDRVDNCEYDYEYDGDGSSED